MRVCVLLLYSCTCIGVVCVRFINKERKKKCDSEFKCAYLDCAVKFFLVECGYLKLI